MDTCRNESGTPNIIDDLCSMWEVAFAAVIKSKIYLNFSSRVFMTFNIFLVTLKSNTIVYEIITENVIAQYL